jgi:hypothetical protein
MITCAVLCGILAARNSQPWYIAIGFGIPVTVGVILNRIDKYLNR